MLQDYNMFSVSVLNRPLLQETFSNIPSPKSDSCLPDCLLFTKPVLIGTVCYPELSLLMISWIFCPHMTCVLDSMKWQLLEHFREHISVTQASLFFFTPCLPSPFQWGWEHNRILEDGGSMVWHGRGGWALVRKLHEWLGPPWNWASKKVTVALQARKFFLVKLSEMLMFFGIFNLYVQNFRIPFPIEIVLESQPHNSLLWNQTIVICQ